MRCEFLPRKVFNEAAIAQTTHLSLICGYNSLFVCFLGFSLLRMVQFNLVC
jgi:hypothetical protein